MHKYGLKCSDKNVDEADLFMHELSSMNECAMARGKYTAY